TYIYTGLSKLVEDVPAFQALGSLNDLQFFRYNSRDRKSQPVGLWRQQKYPGPARSSLCSGHQPPGPRRKEETQVPGLRLLPREN
ncbi:AZGP1 isoform 3, partial [Pongo abelii]